MVAKSATIEFPLKGLNEAAALSKQPGGRGGYSTASCENVVGFDPRSGRNRGASRAGLRKYTTARVSGASAGQCIVHVTAPPDIDSRVTETGSVPSRDLRVTENGVARDLEPATPMPVGSRTTTIVAVAGGNAAIVSPAGTTAIQSGNGAFSAIPPVIYAEPFFQDIYFCDGANYRYYDVSANLMATWEAVRGTLPQQAAESKLITGATNAAPIVLTIASHGYVTGDQVLVAGVLGNTAANGDWTITVLTANTFSLNGSIGNGAYTSGGTAVVRRVGSKCSLIAVWGGRIVLSGLATDPNNIFMSAVGDPLDWEYSPEVQTVEQAVAGNLTAGYGKNADIVTALIPTTDDVLIIGGANSIRKLLGNPAEGGLNVSVTDITGIAPGKAWCQSPEGVIYFFGSRGGVYRMDPQGGIPNRLTATSIDERLADINIDANVIRLLWDDRAMAVRVYITPKAGGSTRHYVWDVRNEAWWPFSYASNPMNPLAVHLLYGGSDADRKIMEYGQDGYIRTVDTDVTSDDGTAINSHVMLGPFADTLVVAFEGQLSDDSDTVTVEVCTSSTEERALTQRPRAIGKLKKGRGAPVWTRSHIERGYIRLTSLGPWAFEAMTVVAEAGTPTLQRVMRTNR
jgi:hypothetical protein